MPRATLAQELGSLLLTRLLSSAEETSQCPLGLRLAHGRARESTTCRPHAEGMLQQDARGRNVPLPRRQNQRRVVAVITSSSSFTAISIPRDPRGHGSVSTWTPLIKPQGRRGHELSELHEYICLSSPRCLVHGAVIPPIKQERKRRASSLQQLVSHIGGRCNVQSCIAIVVDSGDRCATPTQHRHNFNTIMHGRDVQWAPSPSIRCVNLRSSL